MSKLTDWLGLTEEVGAKPEAEVEPVKEYVPADLGDLVGVIKRTPESVLDWRQKKLLAAAMSFEERKVSEAMLVREKMVFVKDTDFLGPLMLDKLYKSGFAHFPVVDGNWRIAGLLHTEALNNLEIRDSLPAKDCVDKNVIYVRGDYLLTEALAVMLRNDRDYLMVIDEFERLIGMISLPMIIKMLLGYVPEDDFKRDDSAAAVSKRKFEEE